MAGVFFLYLLVQAIRETLNVWSVVAHQHSQVFMLRPSCDTVACALGKTWGIFKKPVENAVAQRGMASPMGFEPVF